MIDLSFEFGVLSPKRPHVRPAHTSVKRVQESGEFEQVAAWLPVEVRQGRLMQEKIPVRDPSQDGGDDEEKNSPHGFLLGAFQYTKKRTQGVSTLSRHACPLRGEGGPAQNVAAQSRRRRS